MLEIGIMRVAQALPLVPEPQRDAWHARFATQDDAALLASLTDEDLIRARCEALPEDDIDALASLLSVDPAFLETGGGLRVPMRLVDDGFVFPTPAGVAGENAVMPIEVRSALFGTLRSADAPLAVMLATRELDDLLALAQLHSVADKHGDDRHSLAIAIARTVHDIERLDELFEHLHPTQRTLLEWLCEVDGAVPNTMLTSRADALDPDAGSSHTRVLERFGLVQVFSLEDDELACIPSDTREALRPILETAMSEACREWYVRMREDLVPAFADLRPTSFGGSIGTWARYRVLRAQFTGPDSSDPLDRLLTVFRVIDPNDGVGELASFHLDLMTDDAIARHFLRGWMNSLDDVFTHMILEPFGGDPSVIADWILEQPITEDPLNEDLDEPIAVTFSDRDAWMTLLFQLRGHLLMALSLLPDGHWVRISHLSRWFCAMYRRVVWTYGAVESYGDDFPRHALPLPGVDVGEHVVSAVQEALTRIFFELLAPIGAVRFDSSGSLFAVNGEALRVFRDNDEGFDLLSIETEDYAGSDVDRWRTLPTDMGTWACGVAQPVWLQDNALLVSSSTHMHDLLAITAWAQPVQSGGGIVFMFNEETVGRGLDADQDPARFLLWLRARTGEAAPGRVRTLFPVSSCAADDDDAWQGAAEDEAAALLERLESWHEHPPVSLVEAIRSWGVAGAPVLTSALAQWVKDEAWSLPAMRHVCTLLGEIGDASAAPLLLSILREAPQDIVEGAAVMAAARLGAPALDGLLGLYDVGTSDPEKRMLAALGLSTMAVLHPVTATAVAQGLAAKLTSFEEPELATRVGLYLAETGHPLADSVLYQLKDQSQWVEEMVPFDEALWVQGLSPAVWGPPYFAAPLAHMFPSQSESTRMREAAGVEALVAESGVSEENLLGVKVPKRPKASDKRKK